MCRTPCRTWTPSSRRPPPTASGWVHTPTLVCGLLSTFGMHWQWKYFRHYYTMHMYSCPALRRATITVLDMLSPAPF